MILDSKNPLQPHINNKEWFYKSIIMQNHRAVNFLLDQHFAEFSVSIQYHIGNLSKHYLKFYVAPNQLLFRFYPDNMVFLLGFSSPYYFLVSSGQFNFGFFFILLMTLSIMSFPLVPSVGTKPPSGLSYSWHFFQWRVVLLLINVH